MQKLFDDPTARAVLWTVLSFLATAIVNLFLRTDSPEGWGELKRKHPRIAGLFTLLRGAGIDPYKIVDGLRGIVVGAAKPEKPEEKRK